MLVRPLGISVALAAALLFGCTPKAADRGTTTRPAEPQDRGVVAFYNLENLFDTDDDPENWGDDEFLPEAKKRWTPRRYQEKLGRLARVVLDLGGEASPGGPALLGVCEVENAKVLHDLAQQAALVGSDYDVVHFESPDGRGIDCAALYRKGLFEVEQALPIGVDIGYRDDSTRRTTRDIVMVRGRLRGDPLTMFVNHWPSRRGGEAASRPRRVAAATRLKHYVDSLRADDPDVDIVLVGDFNDDPTSASIREVLRPADRRGDAGQTGLYNPMASLHRQGTGSLGYRDSWNLFDQVIVSEGLAAATGPDWSLEQAQVLRAPYLLQTTGRFRGYPLRTFVGDNYLGGYSDHLPVYAVLTRPRRSGS